MKKKTPFQHFNQKINYSSCNEDSSSELKALQIRKDDVVLTITGSGARALDLLVARPKKILSIDMNPLQNFFLELKIAAIQHLSHEKYLEFFGLRKSRHRIFLYRQIRDGLSAQARNFWDGQRRMIQKGLIYQGGWERCFKMFSLVARIARWKKIKKLFSFSDVEKQREFSRKEWNTKAWRLFIHFVCSRFLWKFIFRDPGFYLFVPKDFPVGDYTFRCLSKSLETHLAKENCFLSLLLLNRFINEKAFPIYLHEKYYSVIKKNISRIEIITDSLQNTLKKLPEKSINKFSLSDISSYTSEEEYRSILESCIRVSAPGAIFCIRHFLVKRGIPEDLGKHIHTLPSLQEELARSDLSFAYTFSVGKITEKRRKPEKKIIIREYLPSDNQAALLLEERCPQGEELKIGFHRKYFHQRSEMYDDHLILAGFYEKRLVALVAGAVKEILVNGKKIKAGHFYDLRVDPDYRRLKLGIARKMCHAIVSRISPKAALIYCLIAGRNLRALHLVKKTYHAQVIIPFKYIINPVYKKRKVKGSIRESGFEETHKNFLKYHPRLDFYCSPDRGRLYGYVNSYGLESCSGEAGCSVWSSKEILGERIESIPKKFRALRSLFTTLSPFIRTPYIPREGESLDSWYLFDFYASDYECAKDLFLHINNLALQQKKHYIYIPLKEKDGFFPVLRKCCWKFSPFIDYYILASGNPLPHSDSDIYIDVRDL